MSRQAPTSRTIRTNSGIVWLVIVGAIVAFLLVDLALRGTPGQLLSISPWLLLITWTVWALGVYPCIVADREVVEVRNPLRTYRFGWQEVAELSLRWQVAFRMRDGKVIASWAVPVSRSRRARAAQQPADREVEILQELREARSGNGEALTSRWNLLPIGGFVALLAWGLLTAF